MIYAAQINCGLVAMQLMQAARVIGHNTIPLGACDRAAVSKELHMDEERTIPIMLLAIGKGVESGMPFRLPVSEVAGFI